jgi:signal transduction histidine kinase
MIVKDVVHLASNSGRAVSDVAVVYRGNEERCVVSADPAQLRQLVWNLIRNAVQASSPGGVVDVRVEAIEREVVLTVTDQGIGIDDEAKGKLFDPLYTTRSHGTGIGLAVVKRIADEHGFTIEVRSQKGKGASFVVTLGRRLSNAD